MDEKQKKAAVLERDAIKLCMDVREGWTTAAEAAKAIIAMVRTALPEQAPAPLHSAVELWLDLFEAFPPLDPASEYYDDPQDGGDVVEWIAENADDIRAAIDAAEEGK